MKTSGSPTAEVIFYIEDQGDPVLAKYIAKSGLNGKALRLNGRSNNDTSNPTVIQCTTTKRLGPAAGNMTCAIKAPSKWGTELPALEDILVDDTWFDIVINDAGARHHVMRGLTRGCRRADRDGGSVTWTVSGEDFGRIFAATSVWFNQFAVGPALASDVNAAQQVLRNSFGAPNATVKDLLLRFLASFINEGVYSWSTPRAMPVQGGSSFPDVVVFDDADYVDTPKRLAPSANLIHPGVEGRSLWDLAVSWQDPQFCELFADLSPPTQQRRIAGPIDPEQGFMAVTFRDRPFPRIDLDRDSLWFKLPMTTVDVREIEDEDVGRSGDERFNSFAVGPALMQSVGMSPFLGAIAPKWDQRSVRQHGLRRFDVNSPYFSDAEGGQFGLSSALKDRAIDFYALNPYYLNGGVDMLRVRPEIRIGHRFRTTETARRAERTYYVEEVTHQMTAARSTTKLGVTRGWSGDEQSMMSALITAKQRYADLFPTG